MAQLAYVYGLTYDTAMQGHCFFFSSRRRHTRCGRDWSSDVCSSDLLFLSPEPYPLLSRRRKDRENRVLLQYRRTLTRCQSSGQQTASARLLTSLILLARQVLRSSLSGS